LYALKFVHRKSWEWRVMINDAIVDEVRKYRQEHTERYGHNLRRIAEALRERKAIFA